MESSRHVAGKSICAMKRSIANFPELVGQFHTDLNGNTQPNEISHGSKKKIWWQCPSNPKHVYDMSPNDRTGKSKAGCPYCSGRRTLPEDSLEATHNSILREWDHIKNIKISPSEVRYGSGKKVWWTCSKNHSYQARISDRTLKGSGCPYCSGKIATTETSLSALYPEVAINWHPTKNGNLRPDKVTSRSDKKAWFTCPNSSLHDYQARIADTTDKKKVGCPYCSGVKVAPDTSLAFKFPRISKEWHPFKNGKLTPEKITSGSNKMVWWLCEKGHEYKMQPHTRTYLNRGCNQCSKFGSSQETRIYCELKYLFPDIKFRHKISGFEVDLYIPSIFIAVEYDGAFYHQDRSESDCAKNSNIEKLGIQLIRIRESPLPKISDWDVVTSKRELTKPDLDNLLSSFGFISPKLTQIVEDYHSRTEFINNEEYSIYLSYFPSPFPENSLAETHPHVASQWDDEKNSPLTPYNFTYGSGYKAFWVCDEGHVHQTTINSKVSHFKSASKGCAYCSGGQPTQQNSLASMYPELSKEWHPHKNKPLTPGNVSVGSDRIVWWQCPVHPDVEWEGRIRVRARGFQRCQKCAPRQRNSIDPDKVRNLSKQGVKAKAIAEALGISIASVNRLK